MVAADNEVAKGVGRCSATVTGFRVVAARPESVTGEVKCKHSEA